MGLNYHHRVISYPGDFGGTTAAGGSATTITTAGTAVQTVTAFRVMRIVRWGVIVTTAVTATSNAPQFTGAFFPGPIASGTGVTGATATVQTASGYNASAAPPFYVDTAGGTLTI